MPNISSSLALLAAACCVCIASAANAHGGGATTHSGNAATQALHRTTESYSLPDVMLVNQDGRRVNFRKLANDGRPVVLNFIYTTCATICPVNSQVLMQFRDRLGSERNRVNMLSVSIDPERDSPRELAAYARSFGSAGIWSHLTGSAEDSVAIQQAFDAWRGDKMNHVPLTFLRAAPDQPWVRLEGFYSPDQVVAEYKKIVHSVN
jgi:protein SCO1